MVETGFHSAKYCSALGIDVVFAKAFERNVSGKVNKKETFATTRASLDISPANTPAQERAYPKKSSIKNPKKMWNTPEVGRQPTM